MTVETRFSEEPSDPIFEKMIPADLEIIRTKAIPYQWTRLLGVGDLGLRSFWSLYRAASRLIQQRKIRTVFISSPPWYIFLIGTLLKKKFGIKLVLDYIDPWVVERDRLAPIFSKRYGAGFLARRLDPIAVRSADAVISVSENINETLKNLYPESAHKIKAAIPYGVELEDSRWVKKNLNNISVWPNESRKIHIVYAGVVWPGLLPVLEILFESLAKVKARNPSAYQMGAWHFFGTSYARNASPQVAPIADRFGVSEVVHEETGRLSYPMALAVLAKADILLALGSADPHYASSKIYSCLASGRPIFGLYDRRSSAAAVLEKIPAVRLIRFDGEADLKNLVESISTQIENFESLARQDIKIDDSVLEARSAKTMTAELVKVFELLQGDPV